MVRWVCAQIIKPVTDGARVDDPARDHAFTLV